MIVHFTTVANKINIALVSNVYLACLCQYSNLFKERSVLNLIKKSNYHVQNNNQSQEQLGLLFGSEINSSCYTNKLPNKLAQCKECGALDLLFSATFGMP